MGKPLFLVTGATGTIGSATVRALASAGHRVRALVRDPAKAKFDPGVDIVVGDLARPETVDTAFTGVQAVLVVVNGLDLATLEANAFMAAKQAGVGHIVKISGRHLDADFIVGSVLAGWHKESESRLRALGVRWTILRPSTLSSNLLLWLNREQRAIALPVGDGSDTFLDPRDVADVAAAILVSGGHDGALYELTGPASLRYRDAVEKIGAATGQPVFFVDLPEDVLRQGLIGAGIPPSQADALLLLFAAIKAGKTYPPTNAVAELLGRPARTFGDWLRGNVDALRRERAQPTLT